MFECIHVHMCAYLYANMLVYMWTCIHVDVYEYITMACVHDPGHSTETALLKVVNDLFLSLNKGNISVLALLNFSSAFDIIDHPILVHRLHTYFGFTDTVLQWS